MLFLLKNNRLLFLFCLLPLFSVAHEKHISLVSIDKDTVASQLQITVKIEHADINHCIQTIDSVESVLNRQLQIQVDGAILHFENGEQMNDHDLMILYSFPVDTIHIIEVCSDLMLTCFPAQKTILAINIEGVQLGRVLDVKNKCERFEIAP